MKNYNWKKSFPEPTQQFHEALCGTLNNLKETEKGKMKKISVKKGLIIAAAVSALIVSTAAVATRGTIRTITGSSTSFPNYREIPAAEKLEKDIGITPKILPEFSNGYKYSGAVKVNKAVEDFVDETERVAVVDENGKEQKYKSLSIRYENGDDKITLSTDPTGYDYAKEEQETENYKGISIRYHSFANKFVPGDYVQTEQDIKDENEGKYVFSYGTDDIEIHQVQGVTWVQDGIQYHINAMDSPLGEQALLDMAKEVIDFK